MRHLFILLAGLMLTTLIASAQPKINPLLTGIWTEKQNDHASIQWLLEGKDEFAQISYWANGQELGGNVRKGTFLMDTIAGTIKFKFSTSISIRDNTIKHQSGDYTEWKIISLNENEILISRLPAYKDEKPNRSGDLTNIYITLVRLTKISNEAVTLK